MFFCQVLVKIHAQDEIPLPTLDDADRKVEELVTLRSVVVTEAGDVSLELHLPIDSQQGPFIQNIVHQELPRLVAYFGWAPKGGIHLHLDDQQPLANGFARVFPHNFMGIYQQPPVGEDALTVHAQYMRSLIIHELIHIIHMDQTRGILQVIRSLFGAVGKLGGVTPRWFSEGIATWGESAFTSGGRLNSPMIQQQLKLAFADDSFCSTIDCLDNPGKYPFGHLPYWVGAAFLGSLEDANPGAIACLVRENSRRLPFFLNRSFHRCTGKSAQDNFSHFRDRELRRDGERTSLLGMSLKEEFDGVLVEKGHGLGKTAMIQVELDGRREVLTLYNLRDGSLVDHKKFRDRIHSIAPMSSFSFEQNQVLILGDNGTAGGGKRWWRVVLQDFKSERLRLSGPTPDYLFEYDSETFLGWSFEKGRWVLRNYAGDESSPLIHLDERVTMRRPRLIKVQGGWQMVFAAQWLNQLGEEVYTIKSIGLDRRARILYSSRNPFELLDAVDDLILVKASNEVLSLGKRELIMPSLNSGELAGLSLSRAEQGPLFLQRVSARSPRLLLRPRFRAVEETPQWPMLGREQLQFPADLSPTTELEVVSYPGLRHFRPKYWAFGIGGSENLTRYDVSTGLMDPMARHDLMLMGSYYQEISEGGGLFQYTYRPSSLGFSVGAGRTYTVRGSRQSADRATFYDAQVFRTMRLGRVSFTPSVFYLHEDIDDFLSTRTQQSLGIGQSLSYQPLFSTSFIGPARLTSNVYRQSTDGFSSFIGERHRLDLTLRSGFESLNFHLRGTMARLRKNTFLDGVLYGGGSAALYNLGGFHEFYGVEYGDLFGNKMRTARGQIDWRILSPYRGRGLFPLYLKTVHLLLGVDYAQTEAAFIGREFVESGRLTSYHTGLSFKTDFAYFIPLDFDFIYASVQNPNGANANQFLFLLRGNFDLSSY